MRITLNDRYIKGTVAFEELGNRAKMSYIAPASAPFLPPNSKYDFGESGVWLVVSSQRSDYNPQVINVELQRYG